VGGRPSFFFVPIRSGTRRSGLIGPLRTWAKHDPGGERGTRNGSRSLDRVGRPVAKNQPISVGVRGSEPDLCCFFLFAKIGSETDLSVLVDLNSIDTGVLRGSDLRLKTCSNSLINLTRRNNRSMQTQIRSSRDNSNKL
jgi:hypothetical protein